MTQESQSQMDSKKAFLWLLATEANPDERAQEDLAYSEYDDYRCSPTIGFIRK